MSSTNNTQDHHDLHIFFFPYLASGHMIPLLDTALLFAARGVKVSYVTTAGNLPSLLPAVSSAAANGASMQLLLLPFPFEEAGLPSGCENTNSLPMTDAAHEKFYNLIQLLQQPLRQLIVDHRPDFLVADELYPWTSDLAISLNIPRVVFNGTSHFTICILDQVEQMMVNSRDDDKPFVVHEIEITKAELPKVFHYPKIALDMFREASNKSYGLLLNSFDELVPEYVERLKTDGKSRRVWNVGPVSLRHWKEADNGKDDKGIKAWLDDKKDRSVLYIAFGSECVFSDDQLREIGLGLEGSGRDFIWVVRGGGGGLDTIGDWLPKGFEEKVEGRGLVVRGWAPQRMILNHPALGAFMMQCGWNSTLEALSCGVPMIAWPLHSEQFVNERLIVQVLGTGASAIEQGVKRSIFAEQEEVVKAEAVKRAVDRVMGEGGEAAEIRSRAEKYKKISRSVVEEGGSSHVNLTCMIQELTKVAREKKRETSY
ncbi:scopoletin glucosyltransferase-like [Asparagus officinalis]|uniref:scopoletin glucosyltransferase-like n=1 Tax=Asparagus officinalis TaxID=4686 RepID=UPI00098E3D7A|nr:scopoletin glucosyltransferase-like [Asparagus officinalis]